MSALAPVPDSSEHSAAAEDYALFRRFPRLAGTLDRIPLGTFPTAVEKLEHLAARYRAPHVYVKRDDRTSTLYGGNKVRKLELLLAAIKDSGARTVMTGGGTGSNHAVATAAFAREVGLEPELFFFEQPVTQAVRENLLLDQYFGARMHRSKSYGGMALDWARAYVGAWRRDGVRPGFIFPGGSSPLGTIGYVNALIELDDQCRESGRPFPHVIFVPVGSCGTLSGIIAGSRLIGRTPRIIGVRVVDAVVVNTWHITRLVQKTLRFLESRDSSARPPAGEPPEVILLHKYFGGEYGRVLPAARAAIDVAEHDGLHLDAVYTGKAYAALMDYLDMIENRELSILFWNTKNSVDQSARLREVEYRSLPPAFHAIFEEPLPTETIAVDAVPVPLRPGMAAPKFVAPAVSGETIDSAVALKDGPLVLVFSRYIGCPLCQLSLGELARAYPEIKTTGARVVVFLESASERILKYGEKNPFPFDIVPDPHGLVFDAFGVAPGGPKAMLAPGVLAKNIEATKRKHFHGAFEGRETQRPAAFVVDTLGIVRYAHYGQHIGDTAAPVALSEAVTQLSPHPPPAQDAL